MTSKKGQTWRIEADIDKNREEANWKKVIDLADQLKTQCPSNGAFKFQFFFFFFFLRGEEGTFYIMQN